VRVLVVSMGVDRPFAYLMRKLVERGVSIDLITKPGFLHHELLDGIPMRQTGVHFRNRFDGRAARAVREHLAREHYDLVHAWQSKSLGVTLRAIGRRRNRPRVVAYRGAIGNLSRFDPTSRLTFRNRKVDRIICVSEAVREYLLSEGYAAEKVSVVHKGHLTEWYEEAPEVRRSDYGIPDHAFLIGLVANMRPVKGADVLLEAFRLLPSDSNVHLALVGHVHDQRITRLANDPAIRGRVHLTGFLREADALMRLLDVFVLPSRSEGMGKSLIEAMILRVPVVATAVGGNPEIVRNEVDGILVPPEDPPSMAEAIARLQNDPAMRERFATSARTRVTTAFHADTSVEETLAVYEAALRAG